MILLNIFKFPVLGPFASKEFDIAEAAAIYVFAFLYSWLWVEISMTSLRFLSRALGKSSRM